MIKLFFVICFLIVVTGAKGQTTAPKEAYDFSRLKLIELPRPNSGTFSYEQTAKRLLKELWRPGIQIYYLTKSE